MATASGSSAGSSEGTRKSVMPVAAYGVVVSLLVAAGIAVFVSGGGSGRNPGGSAGDATSRSAPPALADASTARSLKLPPPPQEKAAAETPAAKPALDNPPLDKPPIHKPPVETAAEPARSQPLPTPTAAPVSPAQAEAENKPEPPKSVCKVDLTRWPTDKTDQAQTVQMMLRDLGHYRGTTNGTVGPQTRTAIREFQIAVGEGETGEISEALFEVLKKKCMATP